MVRTLLGSLVGAGAGFVAGFLVIVVLAAASREGGGGSDVLPLCVFVGVFLAGAGAIAGAVIGGVADLLAYFRRKDQSQRVAQG